MRIFAVAFGLFLCSACAFAGQDHLDPDFAKIPFEQWLSQPDQLHLRWSVKVSRPELTVHQRFASTVDVALDGKDLDPRRSDGLLVIFMQATDEAGVRYQTHGSIELGKLDRNVKNSDIVFSEEAFFAPGEYKIAVAILDTTSGEHATNQSPFRVQQTNAELLRDAWVGLPSVEFIDDHASPESWYLPNVVGRVQWAKDVSVHANLGILLNMNAAGLLNSAAMSGLLPSLKVLANGGAAGVSAAVSLWDFSRHRSVFSQTDIHELDWPRMSNSLKDTNSASIDVQSLAHRDEGAQFFVAEVRRMVRAMAGKPCVLIVLSAPIGFDSHEDLTPIETEALPSCKVIYVRYYANPVAAAHIIGPHTARGMRIEGPPYARFPPRETIDQLAGTLKPLSPKVLDVQTPGEWTKAIAEIRKALANAN